LGIDLYWLEIEMYQLVTPGLWLFLFSLFIAFFPHWFVLPKYERKLEGFIGKFLFYYFVQGTWFFISLILGILIWAFLARRGLPHGLAILAMFYSSIALFPAFFSAVTGVYLVTDRKGYYCYEHYKAALPQPPVSSDSQLLKNVGRLQFILILAMNGVSLVYILM
jgi:hypothetical protein